MPLFRVRTRFVAHCDGTGDIAVLREERYSFAALVQRCDLRILFGRESGGLCDGLQRVRTPLRHRRLRRFPFRRSRGCQWSAASKSSVPPPWPESRSPADGSIRLPALRPDAEPPHFGRSQRHRRGRGQWAEQEPAAGVEITSAQGQTIRRMATPCRFSRSTRHRRGVKERSPPRRLPRQRRACSTASTGQCAIPLPLT